MPELETSGECRILVLHSANLTAGSVREKADALSGILEKAAPDLLVLNGDTAREKTDALRDLAEEFLRPAIKRGIPWVFTFGEGERRTGLNDGEIAQALRGIPGCRSGDSASSTDGATDFTLPVTAGGRKILTLRFFDTHAETTGYERDYGSPGRSRLPYPLYSRFYMDGVRYNQTAWFDEDREPGIPELFFFHTPTPEHAQLPLNQACCAFDGVYREDSRCQTVNGGIAAAAAESRDVLGLICGHEETNDYFGIWAGMLLGVEPAFPAAWLVITDGTRCRVERV